MHSHRLTHAWHGCVLALAAALTFACVAVPSGAAEASTAAHVSVLLPASRSQCPAHSFCMWQNYDWNNVVSGGFWSYTNGDYALVTWFYVGNNANDQATSIYNNRAFRTAIDIDVPPVSDTNRYCLAGGYADSNLVGNSWPGGSTENDSISAFWHSYDNNSCHF